MDEKELLEIVAEDEDQYMEFKDNFIKPAELAEYMMLFANADGGTIFLGIDDNTLKPSGKIKVVSKENTDHIQRAARDNVIPPLEGVTYEIVDCPSFGNSKVLVINIPDSKDLHQTMKGLLARRRGSEREPILLHDNIDEIVDKASLDFDSRPLSDYSFEDLNTEAVALYRERYLERYPTSRINDIGDEELLLRKKAIVEVDGVLIPTLTGILFFGHYEEGTVPIYRVDFVQYAGMTTTDSVNGEMYLDRKSISGTLPEIIDEAERLVTERMATRGYLANGFKRQEVKEYPLFAYREAIINALCHRDYTQKGSAVQIRMFSDRLEILSPGKLAGPVTLENIEEIAFARNPHIANLLKDMGYVEQLGIGIDQMIRTMREAGLEPPEFEETDASFAVVLNNYALLDNESLKWLGENYKDAYLSGNQRNALVFLKKRGRIYNRDYRTINFIDRDTATQDLNDMIAKGVIIREGERGGSYYTLIRTQDEISFSIENSIPLNTLEKLSEPEKRVVKLFENYTKLSTKDITNLIGVHDRQIRRYLQKLREMNVLKRISKSKSDPNTYYVFNEDLNTSESQEYLPFKPSE